MKTTNLNSLLKLLILSQYATSSGSNQIQIDSVIGVGRDAIKIRYAGEDGVHVSEAGSDGFFVSLAGAAGLSRLCR
ncbi:MAG: hypothetical protein IPL46_30870 [Saprospiraceae bacterium]|nr:hypothetical protein [Saprospiraceae bacterium]